MRRTTLVALGVAFGGLLLLEAAPCSAQAAEPTWIRATTEHFTLFSNAETSPTRAFAADLERLRGVLVRLTGREALGMSRPTLLYVFRDQETFAAYQPVRDGRRLALPGYLVPGEEAHYAALGAVTSDGLRITSSIVYRQYLHQILHESAPHMPVWLRHGIAEYYSTFEVVEGETRVGLLREGTFLLLRASGLAPLEELFAMSDDDAPPPAAPPENESDLNRNQLQSPLVAQAGVLVNYLFLGRGEPPEKQRRLIRELLAGTSEEEALEKAYGIDLPTLERELADYLEAGPSYYSRLPEPGEKDVAVAVRSMSAAEVQFHLGDLLLHAVPERRAEAEAHLRRAAELRPDHGATWDGLGLLAERSGDDAAAPDFYAKAVELSPRSARMQYHYGAALVRSLGRRRPETDEERDRLAAARAALGRSVELDPDLADAWVLLGLAWGLEPKTSPEEVAALENALRLLPRRTELLYNLILAHARAGDRPAVEDTWVRMLAYGVPEATLARAREVRLKMDFLAADRLIRNGEEDDAAALLVQISAETRDAALRQQAAERLALLDRAEELNRFAELYTEASRLLDDGDEEAAKPLLEELGSIAHPGLQTRAVEALEERLVWVSDAEVRDGTPH